MLLSFATIFVLSSPWVGFSYRRVFLVSLLSTTRNTSRDSRRCPGKSPKICSFWGLRQSQRSALRSPLGQPPETLGVGCGAARTSEIHLYECASRSGRKSHFFHSHNSFFAQDDIFLNSVNFCHYVLSAHRRLTSTIYWWQNTFWASKRARKKEKKELVLHGFFFSVEKNMQAF